LNHAGADRREGGFTCIELIVAMAILTVAILGVLAALRSSQSLDAYTRERSQVTSAARTSLEEVLARDWDTLSASGHEEFDVEVETPSGPILLKPPDGRARVGLVTTTEVTSELLQIEVSAQWQSVIGEDVGIVLRSMVSRH